MNEAKEEWMPEIYCRGASTPYAYTHVASLTAWKRDEDGRIESVRGERRSSVRARKEGEGGRRSMDGGRAGGQIAKLKHPFPLSPFVRRMMARGESARGRATEN